MDHQVDHQFAQVAEESRAFWHAAQAAGRTATGRFMTLTRWDVGEDQFDLVAYVGEVLRDHGQGVYSVVVWARLDGDMEVILRYEVFHEVEMSEGYGGQRHVTR